MRILPLACLCLALPALAQDAAPPAANCQAAQHQQLDFWTGEFEVTAPDGQVAGHNTIASSIAGCALTEHWRSSNGGEGRSLSFYDRADRQWHQLWVDANGWVLRLAGSWNGKAMVMSGSTRGPDGGVIMHRVTWTPMEDGSVNQHWDTSTDAGVNWSTAFDGTYRRKP